MAGKVQIKGGMRVRAYGYVERLRGINAYVEGTVVHADSQWVDILVSRDVWEGEDVTDGTSRVGDVETVPQNGRPTLSGPDTCRIEVVQ